MPRDRTRLSLLYPATYLTTSGLGMLFAPQLLLDASLSTGRYELTFVRMCGLFVLGLAAFVIQTFRHRLTALYSTIIGVRVVFCTGYVVLYTHTRDPFFLLVLAMVGTGVLASSICYALDRRDAPRRVHRPSLAPLTFEANGLRFAALEWGRGPLVLLFHGFPDTAHTWDTVGPAIARAGYRVVAPFMRGYPPSGLPARDTDARTLGEDVIAIADALGPHTERPILIGHDWGAEAVYAAAALAPEKFDRAIAIAIPHRAPIKPTPRIVWALRHVFALSLPGAARRFAAGDYAMVDVLCRRWSPTWQFTPADLEPVKNALAAPGALDATLGYYRAARVRTPEFLRAPVRVPVLAIAGADDPAAPPALFERARSQFTAGYRVASIPGGHFCHRESPAACLDAILAFLSPAAAIASHA